MPSIAGISSKGADGCEVPRGLSQRLLTISGARAIRVIEVPDSTIGEHAHDWPVLSLYVMGSCTRSFTSQVAQINGPCAVLHRLGEFHSSSVGATGLEQIDIEFDPAWLRLAGASLFDRTQHLRGGETGAAARRLSALWTGGLAAERTLSRATADFLQQALTSTAAREPHWLATVVAKIQDEHPPNTIDLARELHLHPGWLAQGYRSATGEGMQETLMRRRVERAVLLLRTSADRAAEIAAEAGFCDQSHMIRCFRRLLGRTPTDVRAESAMVVDLVG